MNNWNSLSSNERFASLAKIDNQVTDILLGIKRQYYVLRAGAISFSQILLKYSTFSACILRLFIKKGKGQRIDIYKKILGIIKNLLV